MTTLAQTDRILLSDLRTFGVLQDVDGHRLDQQNGVILVSCGDGDQMPDIWDYQRGIMKDQREHPRIHALTLNGGALLIPEDSPLSHLGHRRFLLSQIAGASELKDIQTVVLYAHAPCGAAGIWNLSVERVVDLLKKAGTGVREEFPDMQAVCFLHVDNGRKRTYFVSGEKLLEWQQR